MDESTKVQKEDVSSLAFFPSDDAISQKVALRRAVVVVVVGDAAAIDHVVKFLGLWNCLFPLGET